MSTDVDPGSAGLRERSKARRRAEILKAGMRLFAEKGYLNTTVVEIAEAAEVAPRTVSAYFATKIEIATAFADDIARTLIDRLRDEPEGDLVDVIDEWLRATEETVDAETALLAKDMHEANPELRALSGGHVAEAVEAGLAAVARRSGRPVGHPMVAIGIAAVAAVLDQYLDAVFSRGGTEGLHGEVIAFLRTILDGVRTARP